MVAKVKKSKAAAYRGRKSNPDPSFENWNSMSGAEYHKYRRSAVDYYYNEYKTADLMADLYAWMKENGYSANQIKYVKALGNQGFSSIAIYARCLRTGMPDYVKVHDEYWQGLNGTMGEIKPVSEFLRSKIDEAIVKGQSIYVEEKKEEEVKSKVYVPSIQERLRDVAFSMSEEIEEAIDSFISDPSSFDPKAFSMIKLFRQKEMKAAHARIIRDFYKPQLEELEELASGNADEQLREGYSSYSRKQIKNMISFYQEIMDACEMLTKEAKVIRKPRAKKAKPVEQVVAKLKYKKTDETLKLVSVSPTTIIGSKELWIYNTKTRKIGKYVASEYSELGVKGSTITGFDEHKSIMKTVRKPEEKLKEFKSAGKVQLRKFLDDINSVDVKMNGRLNEETILLKVA